MLLRINASNLVDWRESWVVDPIAYMKPVGKSVFPRVKEFESGVQVSAKKVIKFKILIHF